MQTMLRAAGRLIRLTSAAWSAGDGWLYAAAMAAFAALALAPLSVIALRVAEAAGGRAAAVHGLALVITPIVGHGAVSSLDAVSANARDARDSLVATVLSATIAVFAGSRLFYAMQRALHAMWDTPLRRRPSAGSTVLSFLVAGALAVGFMAVLTVVIFGSAFLTAAAHHAGLHGPLASAGVRAGLSVLGALVLAPVVAALFRWLPGANLRWGDVWIGALTTAIGFALAQSAIGVYLTYVNLPWSYGSAASLIVVLLWLYYSSYVFLLGAQFTQVFAREYGSRPATGRPPR